jgi:putative DNA primase/helicase
MAYQILSLRPKTYIRGGKEITKLTDDEHYHARWRFDDVAELFSNPKGILDRNNVPIEQRYNLFYTVSNCGEGKRLFGSQILLPLDIDGIDRDKLDTYENVVFDTLKLDRDKTAVVSSGNGLHFLILLAAPILSKDYFENWRPQYKAVCKRLDRAFEREKLPGKPDASIFDAGRILRFPETDNIKQDKKTGEINKRRCVVRRSTLLPQVIDLEKLSLLPKVGASDAVPDEQYKRMRVSDGHAAFEACGFLQHAKTNAENLTEPEWYAAASIIGRFRGGKELFHEISKPHPHYNESETNFKLEQALNNSGARTCLNINNLWGKCGECPHFRKISSPIVIISKEVIPSEAIGFCLPKIGNNGAPNPNAAPVPQYNDLLRAFKRDFNYFVDVVREKIVVFEKTHWVDFSDLQVCNWINSVMVPIPKESIRQEFIHLVKAENHKKPEEIEHFFFETVKGFVNLKNGMIKVETMELLPHNPEIGFTYVLPYNYDPEAKTPHFDKYLEQVTMGRQDLKETLLDFMAYCFVPEYTDHCFLWLAGSGRNGKSTYSELLQALMGKQNVSNVMLDFFEKETSLALMNRKLLNCGEESDNKRISGTIMGVLKALSSGASVTVAQKYEIGFNMRPTAKLLFSSNVKPHIEGVNQAVESRFILVPFDMRLEEGERNDIDPTVKINVLAEASGVLNIALSRLKGRFHNFKVHRSKIGKEEMRQILRDSDSVLEFIEECLCVAEGVETSLDDLYSHYKLFLSETRGEEEAEKFKTSTVWFARKIRDKFSGQVKTIRKLGSGGLRLTHFVGIKIVRNKSEF